MGGKAIKKITGIESKRIDKESYLWYQLNVSAILEKHLKEGEYYSFPIQIADKEDFGDIDVIIYIEETDRAKFVKDVIKTALSDYEYKTNNGYVKNSNIFSFDLNGFQLDFIFFDTKEKAEMASSYMDYGDMGMLAGITARSIGLVYGEGGLYIKIYHKVDQKITHEDLIILSRNKSIIFDYLDINYHDLKCNKDVYQAIADSKYFNAELFRPENLNNENRTRNTKRKMYQEFIVFLEENGYFKKEYKAFDKSDQEVLINAILFFDQKIQFKEKYAAMHIKYLISKAINGELITEYTGLERAELGAFIAYLKENTTLYSSAVLQLSKQQTKGTIINTLIDYKTNGKTN